METATMLPNDPAADRREFEEETGMRILDEVTIRGREYLAALIAKQQAGYELTRDEAIVKFVLETESEG